MITRHPTRPQLSQFRNYKISFAAPSLDSGTSRSNPIGVLELHQIDSDLTTGTSHDFFGMDVTGWMFLGGR